MTPFDIKKLVEPAHESELKTLCAIFNQSRSANAGFPQKMYAFAEFLETLEGEQILVAKIQDEIAGFASVWAADRFLHHLYVQPEYQQQGAGTQLLKYCISEFGLPLRLKCNEPNVKARRFYEKLGWQARETALGAEGSYVLYVLDNFQD